jgi:hypothetical protein
MVPFGKMDSLDVDSYVAPELLAGLIPMPIATLTRLGYLSDGSQVCAAYWSPNLSSEKRREEVGFKSRTGWALKKSMCSSASGQRH